jgi:hypothetical protein
LQPQPLTTQLSRPEGSIKLHFNNGNCVRPLEREVGLCSFVIRGPKNQLRIRKHRGVGKQTAQKRAETTGGGKVAEKPEYGGGYEIFSASKFIFKREHTYLPSSFSS